MGRLPGKFSNTIHSLAFLVRSYGQIPTYTTSNNRGQHPDQAIPVEYTSGHIHHLRPINY
jgi:hypothetical protein